jgi:hypothetical protein
MIERRLLLLLIVAEIILTVTLLALSYKIGEANSKGTITTSDGEVLECDLDNLNLRCASVIMNKYQGGLNN